MCGRFQVNISVDAIRSILAEIEGQGGPAVVTGELRPTDMAAVLLRAGTGIRAEGMAWGFPRSDGKGVIFNARVETVLEKPLFRAALLEHPLLVPTTGFYEWQSLSGRKIKYVFRDPEQSVLYLAGCFRHVAGEGRFTILTTAANPGMAPYHHRMPVVIRETERAAWLAGENRDRVLARVPCALVAEPVKDDVVRRTGPVQGTLFFKESA